jgi:hypothetical protein
MPLPDRPPSATRVIAAIAACKLALHVTVNGVTTFGFQRDEFLYFAMGEHLRLWRMDFPPAIAIAAVVDRALLGDSMIAIRMVPALFSTAVLVLAALIARELGGGRFAQGIAALAVLASPLFLRSGNLFQPVVMDQFWWTLAFYALLRLCRSAEPRWWIALGVALGFGLFTKFSALIFGFAVFLAICVTPHRSALRSRWPWIAAAVAFAIGSPSLVAQMALGWPVVGQMHDLRAVQLDRVTPAAFLTEQLAWGPATLLALAGAIALLSSRRFAAFRVAGWACVLAELVLMLAHGKSYYAGPVHPTLIAAGAIVLESAGRERWRAFARNTLRWSAVVMLLAYGVIVLPIGVPILTPERTAAYIRAIGFEFTLRNNRGRLERLPQDFADMLGWEEQVQVVARAYRALTPEEQGEVVIGAGNYGEAGALDYYGPRYGLPKAISSAGSYWFFGPGPRPGTLALVIDQHGENLKKIWDDVRPVAHIHNDWSVMEERDVPVYLCRRPRQTVQQVWPSLGGN